MNPNSHRSEPDPRNPQLQHHRRQQNKIRKQTVFVSKQVNQSLIIFYVFYPNSLCSHGDETEQQQRTHLWQKKNPSYCSLPSSLAHRPPCYWMIQNKGNTHPCQNQPRIKPTTIECPTLEPEFPSHRSLSQASNFSGHYSETDEPTGEFSSKSLHPSP